MKKMLLVLFLFCMFIDVHALSYTDYSDFDSYVDTEIKADDLTDVKVQRRYKYYKYNKIFGSYENEVTEEYPFSDNDDYIYDDYSDWSENTPLEKEGREVQTKKVYKYLKPRDINEIYFKGNGSAEIKDILILDNGVEVDYEIIEGGFDLINTEGLKIKFNKSIDFDKFRSIVYSGLNNNNKIKAIYMNDDIVCFENGLVITSNNSVSTIGYLSSPLELIDYYSDEKLEPSKHTKYIAEVTFYRYRDMLYHLYNLEKEYFPEYLTESYGEYIYKDESKYKDFYAKRTRKLIDNSVVSNEMNFDLKTPFISLSSGNNFDSNQSLNHRVNSKSYKPFKPEVAKEVKKDNKFLFILILIVIIVLLLSKVYLLKRKCVKVKKVMTC